MEPPKAQNNQHNIEEAGQSRRTHTASRQDLLPNHIIMRVRCWRKNRLIDQWNSAERLEIDSGNYSQLVFDKGAGAIQMEQSCFSNKWCWSGRTFTLERERERESESRQRPSIFFKTDSKQIIDWNVTHGTMKALENNTEENLDTVGMALTFYIQHWKHSHGRSHQYSEIY